MGVVGGKDCVEQLIATVPSLRLQRFKLLSEKCSRPGSNYCRRWRFLLMVNRSVGNSGSSAGAGRKYWNDVRRTNRWRGILSSTSHQNPRKTHLYIVLQAILEAQHSAAQRSTAQRSAAQHSTAQHSTAQHSTAQHSTAQHSIAQHSTAYLPSCDAQLTRGRHLIFVISWRSWGSSRGLGGHVVCLGPDCGVHTAHCNMGTRIDQEVSELKIR